MTRITTLLVCFLLACSSSTPVGHQSAVRVSTSGARPYSTVAAGYDHSCALTRSGTVMCWGRNDAGQLGDGTSTNRTYPVSVSGLTNQVSVTAGDLLTCSLGADGTVYCWGFNVNGEVGNGTFNGPDGPPGILGDYFTPQHVLENGFFGPFTLSQIVEVTAGQAHACARDASGAVWCWGTNSYGELGNGTTTASAYAEYVSGISAIGIAASPWHTCALLQDHTVACWGYNGWGALGNGTTNNSLVPVAVPGLANVVQLSGKDSGNCALIADGTVKCWGGNWYGQLGNGTTTTSLTPTNVLTPGGSANLSGVASLASGSQGDTNCAILASGTTYCWGYNGDGEVGNGTTGQTQTLPVAIGATGGAQPNEIATGESHGCTRTADGNLWCWGANSYGELGNGTTTASTTPVYNDIPYWMSPSQRIARAGNAACAIASAGGQVYCWGLGNEGQLGNGTQTTTQPTPVAVSGMTNAIALAGGAATFFALRGDGTVWCWGSNYFGECAEGAVGNSPAQPSYQTTPVQVPGIAGAVAIGPGCAVLSNGTVWCWGDNYYGQTGIGNNTYETQPTPVQVQGLTNVVAVTGDYTRCAVRADGTVWCWGENYGEIGNGTTNPLQLTPAQVTGLSSVIAVSSENEHTCAVRSDGSVWCWGFNPDGELGDGTTTDRSTPVQVAGISTAVAIAASRWAGNRGNSCAVLADGTVRCWGDNLFGQLGIGSTSSTPQTTPVPVYNLSHVLQIVIASGTDTGSASYALLADGSLWSWGDNSYGRLALGNSGGTYTLPTQTPTSF